MLEKYNYNEVLQFRVSRTILGRPVYFNNFYYIDGLLIDSGPPHVGNEVIAALQSLPLEKVVITHQHEDHTGNCRLIQQKTGIPIYAHPETVKILSDPPDIQIYRKILWGNLPAAKAIPIDNVIYTANYQLLVIDTPGHSSDHVSFFEPANKLLFCGDLYLGDKLNSFMAGENIADHLRSLQKVIKLKPNILFCGLKGRLLNADERLQQKFDRWWKIGCEVKKRHDAGLTRKQILDEVFGGETFFYYFSQSSWGRCFMLDSIIENLDYFDSSMLV